MAPAMPRADTCPRAVASWKEFGPNTASEAAAMTKCLLYLTPFALVGLMATAAPAAPAAWSGSMAGNIAAATADAKDAPLVLVRRGGGGGGGRAGGGGFRGGGGRAGGGF